MWPSFKINIHRPPSEFIRAKSQSVQSVIATEKTIDTINQLINHRSCFDKLKRLTTWLLRFISLLQHKVGRKPFPLSKTLYVVELHIAERMLITHTQQEHFLGCFVSNKSLPRYLKKLQPIVIDSVLSVRGRLSHFPFDLGTKFSIILPQRSHLTELVIRQHHIEVGHCGASHTWTSLRHQFWIVEGAAAVSKAIGKCYVYRKRNRTIGKQLMADVLSYRLQIEQPAFSSVGVHFFGPLIVKQDRVTVKRYGCVFTCLTMRAIHI